MNKDSKGKYWVGFDLGGTKMMATVYGRGFKPLGQRKKKTRGFEGAKAGVARVVETITEALDDAGLDRRKLSGIGIGYPGPLDVESGVILDSPNLGWKKTPLRQTLEKAFHCRTVIVNDADAGIYGEYRFGVARGARCAVGFFVGTGIGGGCVYEGRLLRGKRQSCLEVGHLPMLPDGPLCGCGRRGCLETLASRLALSAAVAVAAYRGEAPHVVRLAGTDLANIRSGVLSEAIRAGDTVIEDIVRNSIEWLGRGVATMVNLLAPDVVVLGGGLVEAMPTLYLEEVRRSARAHVMPTFSKTFKVAVARLGNDATALGAAAWAEKTLTRRESAE